MNVNQYYLTFSSTFGPHQLLQKMSSFPQSHFRFCGLGKVYKASKLTPRSVTIQYSEIQKNPSATPQDVYTSQTLSQSQTPPLYQSGLESNARTAKAWPKFGHAMGQRFQVQQQICNRITDKENNQGVAVAQQKSRTQPDWNVPVGS